MPAGSRRSSVDHTLTNASAAWARPNSTPRSGACAREPLPPSMLGRCQAPFVLCPHDSQYGPASGVPQFAHIVWPPATDVTPLIDDCLIHEASRQSVNRTRRAETLVLHHPDEREVLDRIDPE